MYRKEVMKEILLETYSVALPIILTALMGYIVWLLKNQKKDRDANSKGTMLLLKVQLIEYHGENGFSFCWHNEWREIYGSRFPNA